MTVIDRTQCPSCQTVYRISADQLKMADGQVRCGGCLNIFDAPLQGWSTEAVMHASAPAELDAVAIGPVMAELEPSPAPLDSLEQDPPITSTSPHPAEPATPKRAMLAPAQQPLSVVKVYGQWWLLGAVLGAALLGLWGWLGG